MKRAACMLGLLMLFTPMAWAEEPCPSEAPEAPKPGFRVWAGPLFCWEHEGGTLGVSNPVLLVPKGRDLQNGVRYV